MSGLEDELLANY